MPGGVTTWGSPTLLSLLFKPEKVTMYLLHILSLNASFRLKEFCGVRIWGKSLKTLGLKIPKSILVLMVFEVNPQFNFFFYQKYSHSEKYHLL
jgi:hypothetical protein